MKCRLAPHGPGFRPRWILVLALTALLGGCQGGRDVESRVEPAAPAATTPPSAEGLQIGEDKIVLGSTAGRLVVQRAPLALDLQDAAGRSVLRSTAAAAEQTLRALDLQRAPVGVDTPDLPPLYAPISFVVGGSAQLQYPATFWVGNLLTSASTGLEFRLTEVTDARRIDGGVELDVATSDPSGRTARVQLRRDVAGSFQVRVRLAPVNEEVAWIGAAFASSANERFHGFGGRRNAIDQRGQDFVNWTEEFQQRPTQTEADPNPLFQPAYQFPTGPQGAYYVQSSFISSADYGFLLERDALSNWRMGSDRDDAWMVEVAGAALDFVLAPGTAPQAIDTLTQITGRHRMPPRWALGPMLSEAVQSTELDADYEAKVLESVRKMRELDLPVSAFIFEGWAGLQRLGSYAGVLEDLADLGIRPLTYYRAFLGETDDPLERPEAFDEAIANGYVATNALGLPYLFGSPLARGVAALVDFTNPEAVAWWKGRIKRGLDEGSQGFMQDFGEQTFVDMVFHDGSTGIDMHNRYAVLFHRATREAFDEYLAENPGSDLEPWFFVRSGYTSGETGRPGSAAYESASWPGDNTADWSRSSGLGSVVPDMLNRGIGGAYGFVSEIGGYLDTFGRPEKELLIRWSHHASLMPVHRLHGGPVNGTHMPWRYDEETVAEWRRSALRHIAAQPLIMDLWREALATGMPIARPLWLMYPDDAQAVVQEQQWMLGPDVLAAPVHEPGVRTHSVYFPAGCWRHPETGAEHQGPGYADVDAPVGFLPYYFRCGTQPFVVPAELGAG